MKNNKITQSKAELQTSGNRKRHKKKSRFVLVFFIIVGIVLLVGCGFCLLYTLGKSKLQSKTAGLAPQLATDAEQETASESEELTQKAAGWDEGWIGYNGKVYAYNEDIMTFLIMGIDKSGEVKPVEEGVRGGRADAVFLAVLNPHTRKLKLIGINRDTMTDVDVYSYYGNYLGTATQQIALQHAYGDGGAKSAEYMVDAVSKLMFRVPISGYCAINMDAVAAINDAVGGVDLICQEDMEGFDEDGHKVISLKKDEAVHLEGDAAYWYVRCRSREFEGARDRLARQKHYLSAFVDQAKAALKKDMTLPVTMLSELSQYIVTDLTANEITYLASEAISYTFDSSDIYSLEGETKMGNLYEEFYPDKDALNELIIDIFYEEVQR